MSVQFPIYEPVKVPVFMSVDSAVRKLMPVATGCYAYFPDALLLVSWVSRVGNEKHNPGEPLHWAKGKSTDQSDCEARHQLDAFRNMPPDPGLEDLGRLGHLASKAWRALADLQTACDEERAAYETRQQAEYELECAALAQAEPPDNYDDAADGDPRDAW